MYKEDHPKIMLYGNHNGLGSTWRCNNCIVHQPLSKNILTLVYRPENAGGKGHSSTRTLKIRTTSPWPNPRSSSLLRASRHGEMLTSEFVTQPYQPQPDLQGSPQRYQEA